MKKVFFLLGCTLTCIQFLQGQQNNEEATPVHELLTTYITSVNAINKEKITDKVLNLYSDRYTGNTTYIKLSGGIVKKSYTKTAIKKQLNELIQDDKYRINLKINKIVHVNQKEKGGTISALLDFESRIDEELAEKGTMLINIVAVSQKGEWKIIQNNMVRVSETKDIGDCVCYIFNKGETKFIAELYYPDGVAYNHVFETFHFGTNGSSKSIKTLNGTFNWENKTGKVFNGKKELGIAKDQKKVIELLIKSAKNEACSNVIFK